MEKPLAVTDDDKLAFVDYYNQHSILPVSQDISETDFVFRRASLYRQLGIPLSSLSDRSVLEFGPGGGYNATATSAFGPRKYVFVDASLVSIEELQRKCRAGLIRAQDVEVVEKNIFDFIDARRFDLVIIEGVIPTQTKPTEMLLHAASFVANGGCLVTTTTTGCSLLSEICRRLFRPWIVEHYTSFEEQILAAEVLFGPHLRHLGVSTRPVRDWVLDGILQEWQPNAEVAFSMVEAMYALQSSFDFYGSSPRFLIDDRFYKSMDTSAPRSGDLLVEQHRNLALALLDSRVSILDCLKSPGPDDLESLSIHLLEVHSEIIETNSYDRLDDFLYHLRLVEQSLPEIAKGTAVSIGNFIEDFPKFIVNDAGVEFKEFSKWWGRGQQYASYVKLQ